MSNQSSSRERKVRGKKIRSDKDRKELRRVKKELDRATREDEEGDVTLDPSSEAFDDAFVETDEVRRLQERVGRWLQVGRPVHVVGPTGSGKTSLALSVAAKRDRPVVWINGDETMTTADLVGEHAGEEEYSIRDQYVTDVVKRKSIVRDRWVDNPLTIAVREGATLVYNEFSRTKPVANNVLLSVFEEGVLERPGQRGGDRTVDVHPEFRAILTSNSTEYAGVHRPQDALLDRMVGIHVDFYGPETEAEILAAHVDLPREEIEDIVQTVQTLRSELDVLVGTRAAIMVAEGLTVFPDDTDRVDIYTDALASRASSPSELDDLREQIASVV